MSSEKTSVQVAVRIRPITSEDLINLPTRFQKSVLSTAPYAPNQVVVAGEKKQQFSYDYVFGPETTQKDVYDKAVLKLIDKFLEGYNVTILAYGQTSSGKTFTMGTSDNESMEPEDKGIIPRAIQTLFDSMNSAQYKTRKFSIKVSFIEIYNEDLIDLFGEGEGDLRPQLSIREDSKGNIFCSGLQEIKVENVNDVIKHLTRGSLNRQTGATDMNSKSSRSHAIFSVSMTQQKLASTFGSSPSPQPLNDSQQKSGVRPPSRSSSRIGKRFDEGDLISITSKFHFVDLAGSERLKRTSATGDRVKEGISINSGLLALGNVISALGDPSKAKHITHVPYRDSKLTRLLQDSLGGNAQTLMIACVSPAEYNLVETVNTLKYANRARNIKNNATINAEEAGWNDLEHLQSLVIKLRNEIKSLKSSSNGTLSGRSTPNLSGRETPSHIRRPSTPSSSNLSNIPIASQQQQQQQQSQSQSQQQNNNKDVELLEEQLRQLRGSYSKLSQRYAKTSAELAKHQDNYDNDDSESNESESTLVTSTTSDRNSLSVIKEVEDEISLNDTQFREIVEPAIEVYEKSYSSLESQLAITKAALSHSESVIQEREDKLRFAEQSNEQNQNNIIELKNKIAKYTERESTNERYIKDLENQVQNFYLNQKEDQSLINDMKVELSQLKSTESNSEKYIHELENRYSNNEKQASKLNETIEKLEKRLQQRDNEYNELEKRLRQIENDDTTILLNELSDRDKRISILEKSVESLENELKELKNLKELSNLSETSGLSSEANNNDSITISALELKFSELQKTHEETLQEFEDIKSKYQSCLSEIHELQNQLTEARLIHSETIKSTPTTPMSPQSPGLGNSFRLSLPPIITNNMSSNVYNNSSNTLKHKRSKSFSTEIYGDKKDDAHLAVIQRLHNEIQQLSLLHEDKAQGLDAVKQEFARLEISYRGTLDIVDELREELKRRDALAQLEVMTVMTSEHPENASYYSINTSEADELEIVHRLREEVEQLKEEQRIAMESLSRREIESTKRHEEVLRIESSVQELREELRHTLEKSKDKVEVTEATEVVTDVKDDERVIELQSRVKELEQELVKAQETQRQGQIDASLEGAENDKESNEEILELRRRVEKIQSDIASKSHTIATLLLPSTDHQDIIIKRLEDELYEIREVQRRAINNKNSKLATISEDVEDEDENKFVESNDADETIKALEAEAKELEARIIKEKEAQYIPTSRNSFLNIIDPTQGDINKLQDKLSDLQKELAHKSETTQNLEVEQELVSSLQSQLEILKNDIKRKYELIETLKKDLVDKGILQQKLREKESEAEVLQSQLLTVKKRDSEMQHQMRILQSQVSKLEGNSGGDLDLYAKLENVRKEIKESKNNDELAIERLKILNAEESKLQQDLQRLHQGDIAQKERIKTLESRLSPEGPVVEEDITSLKTSLELVRESEAAQKQKILELENKLKDSETEVGTLQSNIDDMRQDDASIKDELSGLKETESQLRSTIQELEAKLMKAEKESEQVQKIKDEINLLKELDTKQKSEIEQLQSQLEETRSAKDATIKELENMKEDFAVQKELVRTLESDLKNVREELTKEKEQNTSCIKELEELSDILNTTKQQQEEEENKKKSLEDELETLKVAGESSDKSIHDLQTELKELKIEKEDRNKLLSEIESKIHNTEEERDKHLERINELTKMLETKEVEKKEAISALENKISDLQSQLEQIKESSTVDQEKVKSLEEKLAILDSQLNDAKDSDKKYAQKISELETELKESNVLLSEKENSLSDKNSKCAELEATIEKTRAEIENIKTSEVTKNDQIKQLETDLEEAKVDESRQKDLNRDLQSKLQEAEKERDDHTSKLAEANSEIEALKEKCLSLQNEINEANDDSLLQSYSNVDENVVEDLSKELKKVQEELRAQKEREDTLQMEAGKLQSEKNNQIEINADLAQQVEQLQNDLESLAVEFSDSVTKAEDDELRMKERISELESTISNPSLASLAAANEKLRRTNDDLSDKISKAENRASSLSEKVKVLESSNNGLSVDSLKAKIKELEDEKRALEQVKDLSFEECQKLDKTIDTLTRQLQTTGRSGNKTAAQLSELNAKIWSLEKDISQAKQKAKKDGLEIARLKEINERFEQEFNGSQTPVTDTVRDSDSSLDSGYVSQASSMPRTVKLIDNTQAKFYRQESTIAQQNNLIKTLQDKIYELERQAGENSGTPVTADLDAVGGQRTTSPTTPNIDLRKSAVRTALPPTPPPNQPLPPPPSPGAPPVTPPPKIPLPPRPDGSTDDPAVEKLNKRIAKLEGDNLQNNQLVETLETSLNDSEANLRIAKQQLQVLQREKSELMNQMKSLKMQLEDAAAQYEQAKSSVQQEKKDIENVLIEERRAKEQAEKSKLILESRMEELIAKKSKFMCF